jgi:5-methylcytosine-specific restriction endonuclease McrA
MWVKVDDGFPEHPKVVEAGRHLGPCGRGRVIAVWQVAMCYCNRNFTDGFIDEATVRTWTLYDKRPLDVATVMAQAGLMKHVDGGFRFHDYEKYQPLAKDVKAKRDWDSRRKQLYAIPGLVDAIRRRDRDRCRYCNIQVNWRDRRSSTGGTYDHIQPRGENTLENVVVACYGCNIRKGGRTPEQARMKLLPPPSLEPDPNQFGTSSDHVGDLHRPDPDPIPSHQKDHRAASRREISTPVENQRVLKALVWREVHALYQDRSVEFSLPEITERLKVTAARAGLVYAVDIFHQQIEVAMQRVPRQARRSAA